MTAYLPPFRWVLVCLLVYVPATNAGAQDPQLLGQTLEAIVPAEHLGAHQHYRSRRVPSLWIGRELAIADLAEAAAPILWFSPREPFINGLWATRPLPAALQPPAFAGEDRHRRALNRTVYYRIRRLVVNADSSCRPELERSLEQLRAKLAHTKWTFGCAGGGLPLEALEKIYVRYMFYYPFEEGTAAHRHDLEAFEVEIKLERGDLDAIMAGPPITTPGSRYERRYDDDIYQATILSASGSAHGVGWYTNVLNLENLEDFVLPLTVLVEEGKHASAPDRDGDGEYKPHYDVNVQSNDAWGIRDTLRTRKLGGSVYREEMTKRREGRHRAFPSNRRAAPFVFGYLSERSEPQQMLNRYVDALTPPADKAMDDARFGPAVPWLYDLVESKSTGTCEAGEYENLNNDLKGYLEGKGFCDETDVRSSASNLKRSIVTFLNKISPGPERRYGFMNGWQRLSFAFRYDDNPGVAAVIPLGIEVPGFGGWMVAKANAIFTTLKTPYLPPVRRGSIEVLYTPSASRIFDWYLAAGAENEAVNETDRKWSSVAELGVKFRFSLEWVRLIRFFGGRVGIRTNGSSEFRNTRLVFELGAGSW